MANPRGKEHTTLTETASKVVYELKGIAGIKMIAPGEIKKNSRKGAGTRYITAVYTSAGMELIISGQSVQKVAVHCSNPQAVIKELKNSKSLREFNFKERKRMPGI